MKTFLKILGSILLVLVLLVAGVYAWASFAAHRTYAAKHETHTVDFPIPFPVSEGNIDNPGLALEQAVERGRHLVIARFACIECHGDNFGGGVMIDAFPIGTLLGPNITMGAGSRTLEYTAKDWDRIVRHGVLPDGRAATMPSEDFQKMSDQELSDIIAYIRSRPPVDNTVAAPVFGPLGKILVATRQLVPSALVIKEHQAAHEVYPPEPLPNVQFGAHLAGICSGCHGASLAGGPIKGGDPAWPPARNLTPHPTGLAGWTYDDFMAAMQQGVRPDGTPIQMPMLLVAKYANNMTPVELQALWIYLNTLTPVENAIP
jgi:mono/diheme cytochrome c family protein